MLYILGITALGVYGIVLGGWSSNSTFPLLGAVRSSAQVISYELAMALSLAAVFLVAGSPYLVVYGAVLALLILLLRKFPMKRRRKQTPPTDTP